MVLRQLVLSSETASLPIQRLLEQAAGGGVEIRTEKGELIAFVLSPHNEEAWAYAEASLDVMNHREEIMAAADRRTGISTAELLQNAERAGKLHDLDNALAIIGDLVHDKVEELRSLGGRIDQTSETMPSAKAG